MPDDPQHIEHVDEVLKLLSVFTNDDRYEMILADKEEVHNMCEVADRLVNKGIEEGQSILAMLINKLLAAGKTDDAMRVTTDEDFREELYRQYGIR